jgi:PPK2 family polyphosphate:nucleotide phosphotransferase
VKIIDHTDLLAVPGSHIQLAEFDPAVTGDFKSKDEAESKLSADIKRLVKLQDVFSAQVNYALLLIFQGVDAAGKDGAIKHVMSGVNPQGVRVDSFKPPSAEELAHDYLWRCSKVLPERGRIGIFNRSYYEEVSVVRVHPKLLRDERLRLEKANPQLWEDRFRDISAYERYLTRNGIVILKFFLHVSKEEQRKRLLDRIDTPEKNWKISEADIRDRASWDAYQHAYGEMLTHTTTKWAPWYIIPSDRKWFMRTAIADVIVERLDSLKLTYPEISDEQRELLKEYRKQLDHPS